MQPDFERPQNAKKKEKKITEISLETMQARI